MSGTVRVYVIATFFYVIATLMQTAIAWAGPAAIPTTQQLNWCEGKSDPTPDTQIIGCSAVIQTGEYFQNDLAIAYRNRGIAYAKKNEYQSAISDFDIATRLNPGDAATFFNRGIAKQKIGDIIGGNADLRRAADLNPNIANKKR
jgi:tetratricopeptide (TPR) repeat protein